MADKKNSWVPAFVRSDGPNHPILWTGFGVIATVAVGFGWFGWTLGSTVTKTAAQATIEGRMSVLAPECARQFVKIPAAMAELDKESEYNYERVVTKHLPEVAGVKTSEGQLGRLCGTAAKELAKKPKA